MAKEQEIRRLIRALADFRTRSRARRELAALGAEAVPALLGVLEDESAQENVRWAAIALLGACGSEDALPGLCAIVRNDMRLRGAAVRALQAITGADVGEDPDAWDRVLRGQSEGEPAAPTPEDDATGEVDNGDPGPALFRRALAGIAAQIQWEEPGYLYLRIPLDAGRKQQMIVTFDQTDAMGQPLAMLYTECAPATPEAIAVMSRRNVTMKYGSFLVEPDDQGGQKIVMRHHLQLDGLDEKRACEVVTTMAGEADLLEYELTQSDHI